MKTLKIRNVNYVRTGYDRDDISRKEFVSVVYSLDDDGRVVEERHFNQDDQIEDYVKNTYIDGLLVKSEQYDGDDNLILTTENSYDAEKHIVKCTSSYGEADAVEEVVFVYDGGLLRKEMLADDAEPLVLKEYFYESPQGGNLVTKRVEYDEDGAVQYIYMYDYDENGQVVEMKVEEVAAKDRRTYTYEYDNHGNRIKELTYNYDDTLIAKKYTEYAPDGRILSEEAEDLDNYKKTVYEYTGDNLAKISVYAKDDALLSWSELQYDADGRLYASADYIIDEVDPSEYRLLAEAYRIYE